MHSKEESEAFEDNNSEDDPSKKQKEDSNLKLKLTYSKNGQKGLLICTPPSPTRRQVTLVRTHGRSSLSVLPVTEMKARDDKNNTDNENFIA